VAKNALIDLQAEGVLSFRSSLVQFFQFWYSNLPQF